jgi:hypothetical protein
MKAAFAAGPDPVTVCALDLDAASGRLLDALDGYEHTVNPAALAAIRRVLVALEQSAGQIGDTLHSTAIDQDSDPWDRTAVHLYNAVRNLHEGQTLLASAQITLGRALAEDAGAEASR